jgi:hypothetical protein
METWMPYFVVLATIAIVVQAIILISLFVQLRRTAARLEQVVADVNVRLAPILSRAQFLLEEISPRISGIASDAARISNLALAQAEQFDSVLSETIERLRSQIVHIDRMVTGTVDVVEETGSRLKHAILGQVADATALVRGIKAGLEYYRASQSGRQRAESRSESQDQGMFI